MARSLGTRILRTNRSCFGDDPTVQESVPVILATVGLAHDLGNPPFGHQGEAAIGKWFARCTPLFDAPGEVVPAAEFTPVASDQRGDFLKFEGNAQTLRLLVRLQNTSGPSGLNLTAGTLAALMKYTVPSHRTAKGNAATKKFGYFASEGDVVDWIREKTGLAAGQRHPLTWLMEASDDAAYSILDVEDAIKKDLVSPEDLRAFIRSKFYETTEGGGLVNQLEQDFKKADETIADLTRIKEIKASYLRTRLVERVLTGAAEEFLKDREAIFSYQRTAPLLECRSFASEVTAALKEFARTHAYNSPDVLRVELQGARVISGLMDLMWDAIASREVFAKLNSRRTSPQAAFVYSKISDSYRWHFEQASGASGLPIRYREMQLLTDMISGMTDRFAVELHAELTSATHG
ncbi:deoxyguanosinetriphosphate triphosphohydrolase [Reyranella soli]|uniref:Deoxyguanosinetriphosphate triphosphohydrolase n=1 Tax=Reyranella soli TaxID=1230389 RepID=A0A512N7E8_9HYPH|nr:deoxyguanosinetriphosphate triphosphohydrolase [Reyranella soli]